MTTAERLVRNLCDVTRDRLKAEHARAVEPHEADTPVALAPAAVRQAVKTLNRFGAQVAAARRVIREAGFDVPSLDDAAIAPVTELALAYKAKRERTGTVSQRNTDRLRAVAELQNAANVAVYGKSGAAAKAVLDKLQADLSKV